MNRSNYQYPPNPEHCCCYCLSKKDYSRKGGRGSKYAETSPSEEDDDEDECAHHSYRNNDKTFARDEVYDNLIDLIDDQMISTMSTLRKKARKFMKYELEQSFTSDTSNRRCNCSEDNRSKGTSVTKKANEIDYQPQSAFLKKMVKQYQCKQSDYSELNESDSPATFENHKTKSKERKVTESRSPPTENQKGKYLGSCCCKCPKNDSFGGEQEDSQKKSKHISRVKKKTKCRGNRKRRLSRNCEGGDRFEPDLKQPHENSCERCWKFASPSRSPVNKPEQRFDPNFRRGHSCISLDAGKTEGATDEKRNHTSECKNLQSILVTSDTTKTCRPTSTPKISAPNKSVQIEKPRCEDYSAQYTPLSKKTSLRSQSYEHSKPSRETRGFDFEYPSMCSAEALRAPPQKCSPRPHSCDKLKKNDSLEKGIIYSSKVRNLLSRPPGFIPARCNYNSEGERHSSQQYKDICGRGRLQNLDPCMKRSLPAKKEDPCQGMDMSAPRGNNSRGSGLGSGLENSLGSGLENSVGSGLENGLGSGLENGLGSGLHTSRGSGLGTGRDEFDKSPQSDIPVDQENLFNHSSQKQSSNKKSKTSDGSGSGKGKTSSRKSSPGNKSPKTKSPSRTPKGSPRGSKGRKGDGKRGTCSANEAQAYFKIPSEPKTPEKCGVSHSVRKCQCYPQTVGDLGADVYCCHCGWQNDAKNESRRVNFDEVKCPLPSENCCSPRAAFPEPSTFQGRRPCPSPNRGYNQKPVLPNIDEYPEQIFELAASEANCTEATLPCPYRSYMSSRPLNDNAGANESRCQRSGLTPRNGNFSYRDGNLSYRKENRNVPYMGGNEYCPGYGNGNVANKNYLTPSQMNPVYGKEYPRKYCVMYMTKGKENTKDDVEVLVEELSQPCPNETDGRMTNVSEKMTRMFKCPTESMALRFQKGISARSTVPQKSRVLYF